MTEQSLFDYETAKFEFESATEELKTTLSRLYSIKSIDFQKIGETQYNDDIIYKLMTRKDKQEQRHKRAHQDFIKVKANLERAFSVLEHLERWYFHKRYILSMTHKEISEEFSVPLEKLVIIRKSLLAKIKDVECL